MTDPRPALDDVRVLDVATLFAGPTAATVLGDFGADVIKVEHPTKPDPARTHGLSKDGVGLWWPMLARNKRTLTLDLSKSRKAFVPGSLGQMQIDWAKTTWERVPEK